MTNSIYYMHVRIMDRDGNISSHGGITFNWIIEGETLFIGYTICSKKDRYNKKIGRQTANSYLAIREKQVMIYTQEDITSILNNKLKPTFFIERVEFKTSAISNTFIIALIRNRLHSHEFNKYLKSEECWW